MIWVTKNDVPEVTCILNFEDAFVKETRNRDTDNKVYIAVSNLTIDTIDIHEGAVFEYLNCKLQWLQWKIKTQKARLLDKVV